MIIDSMTTGIAWQRTSVLNTYSKTIISDICVINGFRNSPLNGKTLASENSRYRYFRVSL
jgi:hypothetical protein